MNNKSKEKAPKVINMNSKSKEKDPKMIIINKSKEKDPKIINMNSKSKEKDNKVIILNKSKGKDNKMVNTSSKSKGKDNPNSNSNSNSHSNENKKEPTMATVIQKNVSANNKISINKNIKEVKKGNKSPNPSNGVVKKKIVVSNPKQKARNCNKNISK